jgi:carboxymethylenebutenolidase
MGGVTGPSAAAYDDVVEESVNLRGRDGHDVPAVRFRPAGSGVHPAIAIGAEATGINEFIRRVGATLAHLGYVVVVPDYYRGDGPPDPEAYEDFDTMIAYIDALDFTRATGDLLAAVDQLRTLPYVDASEVAVWGYCTGATLALFAAELDRRLSAAVLFYPSQPTFAATTDKTPVHAMDLLWAIECPVLVLYGDADVVMPPELLDELRRRLALWGVDHRIAVYAGAGHAFCAEAPMLFDEHAAAHGWRDAVEFIQRNTRRDSA